MKARGWRRVGIVLSVIWFLGFGAFLFVQPSDGAKAYARTYCDAHRMIDRYRDNNPHEWTAADIAECVSAAILKYDGERPRDLLNVAAGVLAADLLMIGLGWLIAWGCIAVGRWIHRGFTAAT